MGSDEARSNPRDADDLFRKFFGGGVSFGGKGGMASPGVGQGGMNGMDGAKRAETKGPQKAPPVESALMCSLEELYLGSTRKMKVSRQVVGLSGTTMQVEEILTVNVNPGWKKGYKITFPEKVDGTPGTIPADLVFIVDEKPHGRFKRDGNDLVYTHRVTLAEALADCIVDVKRLDGCNLKISVPELISPTYEKVVPGEGMPIKGDRSHRGNLRIRFLLKFPARLSEKQQKLIKEVLSN